MEVKTGIKIFSLTLTMMVSLFYGWEWHINKREEQRNTIRKSLTHRLGQHIFRKNLFPRQIQIKEGLFFLKYTIDEKLQKYIETLLKRYLSDFSSVVVIENTTGKILAATGWERKRGRNLGLPFSAQHPAASLAKIITSADLLENTDITNETNFSFRGRGTTLYKYQLRDKIDRWTQFLTLEKAFALSNNVIFGKAAINNTNAVRLHNMATKLGFNRQLMDEINLSMSQFEMPQSQYHLAELASGFNKETLMGPIHAAVLASVIANNGLMITPRILAEVDSKRDHLKNLYPVRNPRRVLNSDSVESLRKMMEETLFQGTARKTFRRMKKKLKENLYLGGKTGSITGGNPLGKRDWFTMYAMPKEKEGGISISVMNVNMEKWFVKSTFLARRIVEKYYEDRFKKNSILNNNKIGLLKRDRE